MPMSPITSTATSIASPPPYKTGDQRQSVLGDNWASSIIVTSATPKRLA